MTRLLALNDRSPSDAAVNRTAAAFGSLLTATVDRVRVLEHTASPLLADTDPARHSPDRILVGEVVDVLLAELAADDVELAVLGCRSITAKPQLAGHVTMALLRQSPVPLVIVPADSHGMPMHAPRLLIPLDGHPQTDTALLGFAGRLASAGAELLTLHVFDATSLPPFVGSTHDIEVLAGEFTAQHLPAHLGPCHLRIGATGQAILAVSIEEAADAIVIAWRQDLSPGRAEVVRRLLRESMIPLIMVPIPPRTETTDRTATS